LFDFREFVDSKKSISTAHKNLLACSLCEEIFAVGIEELSLGSKSRTDKLCDIGNTHRTGSRIKQTTGVTDIPTSRRIDVANTKNAYSLHRKFEPFGGLNALVCPI